MREHDLRPAAATNPKHALAVLFAVSLGTPVPLAGCGHPRAVPFEQPPLAVTASNRQNQPVYLDWSRGASGVFTCEVALASGWKRCSFSGPGCMEECSDQNLGTRCCWGCEPPEPAVKAVSPGDSVSAIWNGKAYRSFTDHCSNKCPCYREVDPIAGRYRAEICVYDGYTCEIQPCSGPDREGVVRGAVPSGAKTCFSTVFEVPNTDDGFQITIL